jgi:1,4-dihydroxy-2-naphthoyl-CoA synthase
MSVRVERNGPVTTVVMNRPEARNAVNGPTAAELFAAFDDFDNDDAASVAVLWGDNGTFCASAISFGVRLRTNSGCLRNTALIAWPGLIAVRSTSVVLSARTSFDGAI